MKEFTKKETEIIYSNLNKKYFELIKWLYDNHQEVLREYERIIGKLRVEFL